MARGLRWWDGARWTDQVTARTTPPAKDASRDLSVAFALEIVAVLGSWSLAWILLLGVANCGDSTSASCEDLYLRAWTLLRAAHPALLVICGAMFIVGALTKRVALKRLAVWVLPVGTGMSWIVYFVISSIAFDA